MKKLSNTETDLKKKNVAYKKKRVGLLQAPIIQDAVIFGL